MIAADLATTLPGSRSFEGREDLSVPAVFYQWFIVDGRTGSRKLMPDFMTCAQAAGLCPGAQPDLRTCEVRAVSRPGVPRTSPGGAEMATQLMNDGQRVMVLLDRGWADEWVPGTVLKSGEMMVKLDDPNGVFRIVTERDICKWRPHEDG